MNPFGATPRCPRCEKLVYAAEQVMGPGRKMYHKPCLSCKSCSKRLDSFSLVEHDSEPYCKQCHLKNFSTKDLRHANLPQVTPPSSPPRTSTGSAPSSPIRDRIPTSPGKLNLANLASPKRDLEQDTPMEPPAQPFSFPPVDVPEPIPEEKEEPEVAKQESKPVEAVAKAPSPPPKRFSIYSRRPMSPVYSPDKLATTSLQPQPPATATATTFSDRGQIGRPAIGSPRSSWQPPPKPSTPEVKEAEAAGVAENGPSSTPMGMSVSEPPQSAPPTMTGFMKRIVPMSTGGGVVSIPGLSSPTRRLAQTFTGTNSPNSASQPLSLNFTGRSTGSPITPNFTGQGVFGAPKRLTPNFTGGVWSGGNKDQCPKCGKAVYLAEGVNAVGKRWHKACLRCSECARSLDSTRLTDRDGEPYCKACYAKLYGPQGSGYALLGKVG